MSGVFSCAVTLPPLSEADRAFCRRLMADEEFKGFRRRRVPASIASETPGNPGRPGAALAVYACDLAILPELLPHGYISDDPWDDPEQSGG